MNELCSYSVCCVVLIAKLTMYVCCVGCAGCYSDGSGAP